MMDTERLESDREFQKALSPQTIKLCAVCRERPEKCECQANNAERRQQVAREVDHDLLEALENTAKALERYDSGHPYIADACIALAKARGENHDE